MIHKAPAGHLRATGVLVLALAVLVEAFRGTRGPA